MSDSEVLTPKATAMPTSSHESRADTEGLATAVHDQLDRIGRLLVLCDKVLRISQPPVLGKFGVAWWRMRGTDTYRTPLLVRWYKLSSGRWRARPVRAFRDSMVRTKGTSAICASETLAVVKLARELITEYVAVRKRLARLQGQLRRSLSSRALMIGKVESRLMAERSFVLSGLREAGYSVEDGLVELPEYLGGED